MTPAEFAQLVTLVEDRWAPSKAWADPASSYPDFAPYPLKAAQLALHDLFAEGRQSAPAPSVVYASIRAIVARGGVDEAAYEPPHEHVWAHTRPTFEHAPTHRGPGAKWCNCGEAKKCHCAEECIPDRWYLPEVVEVMPEGAGT